MLVFNCIIYRPDRVSFIEGSLRIVIAHAARPNQGDMRASRINKAVIRLLFRARVANVPRGERTGPLKLRGGRGSKGDC